MPTMTTQETIYHYIEQHIQQEGYPPDYRTIAAECGISLGAVTYNLTTLETEGYIKRQPRRWRTIELTGKVWE
jgi:SOS-response transcriptional repressor LexA